MGCRRLLCGPSESCSGPTESPTAIRPSLVIEGGSSRSTKTSRSDGCNRPDAVRVAVPMLGRPLFFDFTGEPPDPEWIIDGLIERGTVTVLSADSGAGKSLLTSSMIVAMLQRKRWLGRETAGDRAMVVDEENYGRIVRSRFKALGMRNDDRVNLRYFLRLGITLGASDWFELLQGEMAEFEPDLLVIDTAQASTSVEVTDNTAVARLYSNVLRPLADKCAVLLLHHERKPTANSRRHAGYSMMGARQWAGQADAHLSLERLGDVQEEIRNNGTIRKRFPLRLEMPKSRDGASISETVAFVSEHGLDGKPRWLKVEHSAAR